MKEMYAHIHIFILESTDSGLVVFFYYTAGKDMKLIAIVKCCCLFLIYFLFFCSWGNWVGKNLDKNPLQFIIIFLYLLSQKIKLVNSSFVIPIENSVEMTSLIWRRIHDRCEIVVVVESHYMSNLVYKMLKENFVSCGTAGVKPK